MMYVSDSLSYRLHSDLSIPSQFYESLFIEINSNTNPNVLIGIIYRPPGLNLCSFTEYLDTVLEKK